VDRGRARARARRRTEVLGRRQHTRIRADGDADRSRGVASRKRENSSRTAKHFLEAGSQPRSSCGAKLSTAGPNVLAPADVPAHELEPVYRPMCRSLIARCPVHTPDEDVAGGDHVSLFRDALPAQTGNRAHGLKMLHGEAGQHAGWETPILP